MAVFRDVTERRVAAQLLSETESRFQNMADVSPVLLWMSRLDGFCTFFNQTWLRFTGRTLEQEWGVGWAEGVHFEDFQRCMDTYVDAFNARRVFEMEYRLRRADGEHRWILDRGAPRYSADGAFAGYIGSCIDVTERKAAENELRDAVKSRDEFLSIASHELRTPLTALQLHLDGLMRMLERQGDGALLARLKQRAAAAQDQTVRIGGLIQVLLDVGRIREGRLSLEYDDVDMGKLVDDVAARLQDQAKKAGCEVAVHAAGPIVGRWDPLRLEEVVSNLVSNAIKYGAGSPITIAIDGRRVGQRGTARMTVIDRGIGISAEQQERIFERFERGVSARHYGGFGLGLWISRKIVEAMHGKITVQSAPGQGATFRVELPLSPTQAESGLTVGEARVSSSSPSQGD